MYRLAVAGAFGELAAEELLEHRLDPVIRRGYEEGPAALLLRISKTLAVGAVAGAPTRSGAVRVGAGAALLAPRPLPGLGCFTPVMVSAEDPAAIVEPQRGRLDHRARPG